MNGPVLDACGVFDSFIANQFSSANLSKLFLYEKLFAGFQVHENSSLQSHLTRIFINHYDKA
jgi:hypothetical protein